MRKVRKWLMTIMCLSLIIAITLDWSLFCRIEVIVNAGLLLACIVWDLAKMK